MLIFSCQWLPPFPNSKSYFKILKPSLPFFRYSNLPHILTITPPSLQKGPICNVGNINTSNWFYILLSGRNFLMDYAFNFKCQYMRIVFPLSTEGRGGYYLPYWNIYILIRIYEILISNTKTGIHT